MHGIAFRLFGLSIHWYGIMVAAGFLASLLILQYKRAYAKMSSDQIFDLSLIVVICGILGSRIAYVIQFFDQFQDRLWTVIRIDQGGLVFYGGFILAATVIFLYVRKHHLSPSRVLDICSPAMAIGHAFGRVGCFIQGCCFGIPCKAFGHVYPAGSMPAARFPDYSSVSGSVNIFSEKVICASQPLLPVQLIEACGNLLIGIILLLLFKKIRKSGLIASIYFMSYGVLRFTLEFFRGDHIDSIYGLTRAQWIGLLLMIPVGLFCFLYFRKNGEDVSANAGK